MSPLELQQVEQSSGAATPFAAMGRQEVSESEAIIGQQEQAR